MMATTAEVISGLVEADRKFSMSPRDSVRGGLNSAEPVKWPFGLVTPYVVLSTPLITMLIRASEGRPLDVVIARLIYLSRPEVAMGYPRSLFPPDAPFPKDHSNSRSVRDPFSSA